MVVGTMNNPTKSELAKVRKVALHSVTLSNEIKATVMESRLKELIREIKKILIKKDTALEMVCLKIET